MRTPFTNPWMEHEAAERERREQYEEAVAYQRAKRAAEAERARAERTKTEAIMEEVRRKRNAEIEAAREAERTRWEAADRLRLTATLRERWRAANAGTDAEFEEALPGLIRDYQRRAVAGEDAVGGDLRDQLRKHSGEHYGF